MKTQLKLELNMKKTLLARVVKGIAVCGLAMSGISYAALTTAVHTVEAENNWQIVYEDKGNTLAGEVTTLDLDSIAQHWGWLRITNVGSSAAIGKLTSGAPNLDQNGGFFWTHDDFSQVKGYLGGNQALQGADLSSGIQVTGSSSGGNVPPNGLISGLVGVVAGETVKPGNYNATFEVVTLTP
ncbi:hypothetical protein ACP1PC_002195 [Escherichia coli]|nr:hypothetical protein [Escherichia coli]EJH0658162.1 hypothetical protein [Escherichia coli]